MGELPIHVSLLFGGCSFKIYSSDIPLIGSSPPSRFPLTISTTRDPKYTVYSKSQNASGATFEPRGLLRETL